jgi:hypothetical protein
MGLPSLPRIWINRETSAALFVLYFRVAPDTGSKVLRVSVARTGSGKGAALGAGESSVAVGFVEDFDLRGPDGEGLRRVYLVVMRVYERVRGAKEKDQEERRTVDGLASRSWLDFSSHVSALSRYGIVN